MKLGLLADIHEKVYQLRKAIEVLQKKGADRFVVLGDLCETGTRMEETVAALQEVAAIGVWGNHDFGFCFEPTAELQQQYSAAVLEFMSRLQPRLEIEDCLFTHVEPWLDPNKLEDLWYYDGPPDTQDKLKRCFVAVPNRVIFIGHFHRWLLGSTAGISPWNGEHAIPLDPKLRHLIVVHAVCDGYCAMYDTTKRELVPCYSGG